MLLIAVTHSFSWHVFNFGNPPYLFYCCWASGWFPVWGCYKSASMNILTIYVFWWHLYVLWPRLFGVYLRMELMSHMFSFRRYCQTGSQHVPPLQQWESPSCSAFFLTLDTVLCFSRCGRYVVTNTCGSILTLFVEINLCVPFQFWQSSFMKYQFKNSFWCGRW